MINGEMDNAREKKQLYIIDLIKAVSCIMIFLYHCNTILPGEWKWLSFCGEDMGNNLFFMVSGFSLFPSITGCPAAGFPHWYLRRLKKILPLLVFFYLLSYITGFYSFKDPSQLFAVFVFPTLYWFVTGILIFYILLFLMAKLFPLPLRAVISAFLFVLWYMNIGSVISYYFIGLLSMICGYTLREMLEKKNLSGKYIKIQIFCLISGILVFTVLKYLKLKGLILPFTDILLILMVLCTGLNSLMCGYLKNDRFSALFSDKQVLSAVIKRVGTMALPVYLVQCFNAGLIGFMIGQKIPFPMSFAANFIIVWGSALLLSVIFGVFR